MGIYSVFSKGLNEHIVLIYVTPLAEVELNFFRYNSGLCLQINQNFSKLISVVGSWSIIKECFNCLSGANLLTPKLIYRSEIKFQVQKRNSENTLCFQNWFTPWIVDLLFPYLVLCIFYFIDLIFSYLVLCIFSFVDLLLTYFDHNMFSFDDLLFPYFVIFIFFIFFE